MDAHAEFEEGGLKSTEGSDPVDVFRDRRDDPAIISYAQNAEDVRLWRIFSGMSNGFYVDVGAGHPVHDSVTNLFYESGWTGLNIEPGPAYEELVTARPRDVNLDVAVCTREGEATLWVSSPDPGLSSFELPPGHLVPNGFSFLPKRVRCARLDTLFERHLEGRTIDFLKIDVEGAEHDVLGSFDPGAIRPTVILVEAISPLDNQPNYADWERLLIQRDYVLAAFDGVNRFYVPVEHAKLLDALAYPISVLDHYETYPTVVHRTAREALENRAAGLAGDNASLREENVSLAQQMASLQAENVALRDLTESQGTQVRRLKTERTALIAQGQAAAAHVEAMRTTVSWRITRPLRSVRRAQRRGFSPGQLVPRSSRPRARDGASGARLQDLERALSGRIAQVAGVLDPSAGSASDREVEDSLDALESALAATTVPDRAKAWICLVSVDGSFPSERSVDHVARLLRMNGAQAVRAELVSRFDEALENGSATEARLDIRHARVVVDVGHTVSHDLHTGIQRVVRETVSRWIGAGRSIDLVRFDGASRSLRLLSQTEYDRLERWREHMGRSGRAVMTRPPEEASGDVLVPWRSQLVLPELVAEQERSSAYRSLASASVLHSLSVVGYDLIPMVAAETVADGMTDTFARYLSVVKHADRVSAISRSSADGFRAFGEMARSEGLPGPTVAANPLPIEAPVVASETIIKTRRALGIGDNPVILVVGSHEPRKNHLAILEAAERLWVGGATFELLFLGGSGWKGEEFDRLVASLVLAGRPIVVRKRCSEDELWAAYAFARFTVFPSFLEGFGLPVAESLASGTPAITSGHGSMAEIATDGGCLVVDPRNVDALGTAMSQLLHDDQLLERLKLEAASRPHVTWSDYARDLWDFLTDSRAS